MNKVNLKAINIDTQHPGRGGEMNIGHTTELNCLFGIEPGIDRMARKDPEDPGEKN